MTINNRYKANVALACIRSSRMFDTCKIIDEFLLTNRVCTTAKNIVIYCLNMWARMIIFFCKSVSLLQDVLRQIKYIYYRTLCTTFGSIFNYYCTVVARQALRCTAICNYIRTITARHRSRNRADRQSIRYVFRTTFFAFFISDTSMLFSPAPRTLTIQYGARRAR